MKCSCSFFTFTLFVVIRCYDFPSVLATRINGGTVTTIDKVPYIAQIIDEDDEFCGATIISNYWLVTAAHCFSGRTDEEKRAFRVTTGSSLSNTGEQHEIQQIIAHPGYDKYNNQYNNDIALILLKKPIVFKANQRAIALSYTAPKVGKIMTVSGYGWEAERRRRRKRQYEQRRLKSLNIKVVEQKDCARKYVSGLYVEVPWNSFCATSGRADSTCIRDSGGPGVIDGKLAGIVSGGYRCQADEYPNVYTRVYRYVDWIRKVQAAVY